MTEYFGCVDAVKAYGAQLTIIGWAMAQDGRLPKAFLINFGAAQVKIENFRRINRPDVANYLNIDQADCGFHATIDLAEVALDANFVVEALFGLGAKPHVLSIMPAAAECLKFIAQTPDNFFSLKKLTPSEQADLEEIKNIEKSGYRVLEQIKPGKVYKVIKDESIFIIKKTTTKTEVEKYEELYRRWNLTKDEYQQLYLPKLVCKINGYHVVEFVEGVCIDWSESPSQAGFGGDGISVDTIPVIVNLANDLAKINVHSDFYWRNFIFKDDCVALIDWELDNFRPATLAELFSYLYLLMFNNRAWQIKFIETVRTSRLVPWDEFRYWLLDCCETFLQQWDRYPYLMDVITKQRSVISSDMAFNKIWQGYDIATLLDSAKYHVFEELGQLRQLDSQIDCKGKLDKLELERLNLAKKTVLDVGCNSGWFMKEFVKLGASEVVGLELEKNACQIAESILLEVFEYGNCKLVCGDIMSFESEQFDFIASISMFHYIEDKQQFFFKISRLTKDNGWFLLETPVHEGQGVVVWDMTPKRYIPSIDLINVYAKASGFEIDYFGRSNLADRRVFHFKKIHKKVFS